MKKKLFYFFLAAVVLTPFLAFGATDVSTRMEGRILLAVEDKGQAWYVLPGSKERVFLGRPRDAFQIMREFGLGVSNANYDLFNKNKKEAKRVKGKILLKVEDLGKAYYVNPKDSKLYYMGTPADAFLLMRKLGTGIKNTDLGAVMVKEGRGETDGNSFDGYASIEAYIDSIPDDTDGDGISDDDEIKLGTYASEEQVPDDAPEGVTAADSDGDGYDDYTEISKGYNPLGDGEFDYSKFSPQITEAFIKKVVNDYAASLQTSDEQKNQVAFLMATQGLRANFDTFPTYNNNAVVISKKEKQVIDLLNKYRATKNKPDLAISKKLTFTAEMHALNLTKYSREKGCGIFSWSGANSQWENCCYSKKNAESVSCVANKANELAGYTGTISEVIHVEKLEYSLSAEKIYSKMLGKAKKLLAESDKIEKKAIGISIYGKYAVLYIGDTEDAETITEVGNCADNTFKSLEEECFYNNASFSLDTELCGYIEDSAYLDDCITRTDLYECAAIKKSSDAKKCLKDSMKVNRGACAYVYKKPKQMSACLYYNDYEESKNETLVKLNKGKNAIYFNNNVDQTFDQITSLTEGKLLSIMTLVDGEEAYYSLEAGTSSTLPSTYKFLPYRGYIIKMSKTAKITINKLPGSSNQNLGEQLNLGNSINVGRSLIGFKNNISSFDDQLKPYCNAYTVSQQVGSKIKTVKTSAVPALGKSYFIDCDNTTIAVNNPNTCQYKLGDANMDGNIDAADKNVVDEFLIYGPGVGGERNCAMDCNADNNISEDDGDCILNKMWDPTTCQYKLGDANMDGNIDAADKNVVDEFLIYGPGVGGERNCAMDCNADNNISEDDGDCILNKISN